MSFVNEANALCARIARAHNAKLADGEPILPPNFRGIVKIVIDGDGVQPQDVSVEYRPSQSLRERSKTTM